MKLEINPGCLPGGFIKAAVKPCFLALVLFGLVHFTSAQHHLQRSIHNLSATKSEFSTKSAHYKPIFGAGDSDADLVKGVERFGLLSLAPGGKSRLVNYDREELVYYVLEGTGSLQYDGKEVPITKDDFFYIPINSTHGFTAAAQGGFDMLVMGYKIPEKVPVDNPTLQIANAREVEFQTLEQLDHGVTSRFQLLLGTTESKRDRLAVAYQVNSLFVIDFDPGGTNIPHRHPDEEEIYFVLQGKGDMVAGETPEGEPRRYAAREGDAYFFSRNCLVGFYSDAQADPHTRILAVRSKYPEGISGEE